MDGVNPMLRPRRVSGAGRIRNKDLPVFTRTLAAMLSAGIPVSESLRALREQVGSPGLRVILEHAGAMVQEGIPLSEAFAVYPGVFDFIYTGMLRTGEASGRMAEVLESLSTQLEESAELRHRVQSAMIYPISVAAIALLVTTGLLIWIVPTFESIYADMGKRLPAATRFLISVSHIVRNRTVLVVLLMAAVWAGLRMARRTAVGGRMIDRTILEAPILGPLVQKVAIVRVAAPLAQMLSSGVPILNALRLVARAAGNMCFEDAINETIQDLTQGQTLSVSLKKSRCFTPMMIEMVVAGERTGQLDAFLARTALFYRKEVSVSVQGLTTIIEPLLIVFLGVVVGGVVVCMFIPIFRLHELVQ